MKQIKMTNKEKVIQYLNSCKRNANKIFLGTNSYSAIENISIKEFIDILFQLQDESLLTINAMHKKDGRSPCNLTITSNLINYFENKEIQNHKEHKRNLWEFVKWFVPTIISIIALIISILK